LETRQRPRLRRAPVDRPGDRSGRGSWRCGEV